MLSGHFVGEVHQPFGPLRELEIGFDLKEATLHAGDLISNSPKLLPQTDKIVVESLDRLHVLFRVKRREHLLFEGNDCLQHAAPSKHDLMPKFERFPLATHVLEFPGLQKACVLTKGVDQAKHDFGTQRAIVSHRSCKKSLL